MQKISRRTVLGALAGLTAQGALGGPTLAQAPAARIDTHHHIIPPDWLAAKREAILAANSSTQAILDWSPAGALAEMDRRGIRAAVTSITTPGVWFGDTAEGRRLARICNDYGAQLSREHPGRFGMFAALPLPDIEGSLAEIGYAYDTLELDGIGLLTSYGEHWPGESMFDPVFAELNRRKAIVFFHPTSAACCAHVVGDLPPSIVEYGFNTTRAIESMLFSGTFSRYPDIRYIFSHGGGTVPFLADRIGSTSYARRPDVRALLPDGPGPVLRTLYFDVVSVSNPPAMAALRAMMPPTQLLFGTDNPFVAPAATIDGLAALQLPPHVLASIQHENAAALFPRFR